MCGRLPRQSGCGPNHDAAVFQDLGSAPATFEGSRAVGAYGAAFGQDSEVANAGQAYVQVDRT
eukprot:4515533-Lingulodinium_polyedra.AAC.1